jgi:hypothetical protein
MMAGVLGLDWKQYTLRVLWVMFQGRTQDQWDHTSRIIAVTAQAWGSKKTSLYYHPFRKDNSSDSKMKLNRNTLPVAASMILGVQLPTEHTRNIEDHSDQPRDQ